MRTATSIPLSTRTWRDWPGSLLIGILACSSALAADYGEQPLRANLSDKPFTRTEDGRAGHRFANAEVNRYRIYDYYARQARWHLDHPEDTNAVLLPFTGLDGGRRGHWGVTNETSTEANKRTIAPEFGPLTARGGDWGLHYLRGGSAEHPGVLLYDTRKPGVRQAQTAVKLGANAGFLGGKVDRWGFGIVVQGTPWFAGVDDAWILGGGKPAVYQGHHLFGDQVIYRLRLGEATVLDAPAVLEHSGRPLLQRQVAFTGVVESLTMRLSRDTLRAQTVAAGLLLEGGSGDQHHFHLVWTQGDVQVSPTADGMGMTVVHAAAGAQVQVLTWASADQPTADYLDGLRQRPVPVLSQLITGDPPRYPQILAVTGQRNADPAASGGAYEIDDLPVPVDNPWNQPMTVSGLAFADDGTAYVSTLVGDLWRVSGIDDTLRHITWQRIASGLNLPLGVDMVAGVPYVNCRGQLLALHDRNGDHAIDYVERISQMELPPSESGHDLQRDAQGNFYFNANAGIFRLSADGRTLQRVGGGSRNPLGLAVRADGLVLSDSSEGESYNGTCTIYESDHAENAASVAKRKRILYLPRGIDNSPGSRVFLQEPRFGPLGEQVLGLSYGTGTWYQILRDAGVGTPQAALVPLPGEFASGVMRLRRNPADGQLYVAGLDGWGDYAVAEGSLHRIRFTGRSVLLPTAWAAHANGVLLTFTQELSADGLDAKGFFAQQWNVIDSKFTYGSAEYSVTRPGTLGHDRLPITRVILQADRRSVFVEMPTIRPAACTHVSGTLRAVSGARLALDLYATINVLRPDLATAASSEVGKPMTLALPEQDGAGNTYQVVTEFFDKISGRATVARAVGAEVVWKAEDLTYDWIRSNLIDRQCQPCHAAGTPHDLTSYEHMLSKLNLQAPAKSHLLGMISTNSMPPFPFPTVAPGMRKAVEEWIRRGAPR